MLAMGASIVVVALALGVSFLRGDALFPFAICFGLGAIGIGAALIWMQIAAHRTDEVHELEHNHS
jgi:hypothetical protein